MISETPPNGSSLRRHSCVRWHPRITWQAGAKPKQREFQNRGGFNVKPADPNKHAELKARQRQTAALGKAPDKARGGSARHPPLSKRPWDFDIFEGGSSSV